MFCSNRFLSNEYEKLAKVSREKERKFFFASSLWLGKETETTTESIIMFSCYVTCGFILNTTQARNDKFGKNAK